MGFKFKIGELVVTRDSIFSSSLRNRFSFDDRQPRAFVVVERLWQECPGGVQRHYAGFNGTERFTFNEIQLVSLSEAKTLIAEQRGNCVGNKYCHECGRECIGCKGTGHCENCGGDGYVIADRRVR